MDTREDRLVKQIRQLGVAHRAFRENRRQFDIDRMRLAADLEIAETILAELAEEQRRIAWHRAALWCWTAALVLVGLWMACVANGFLQRVAAGG